MEIKKDSLYTTFQVSKFLNLKPKTVRYKIRMGHIDAVDINNRGKCPNYRVKGENLMRFIDEGTLE